MNEAPSISPNVAFHAPRGAEIVRQMLAARGLAEFQPRLAITLGSGLGGLADRIDRPVAISYGQIPGLKSSSASGHRGEFIAGYLNTPEPVPVIAMAGRLHAYEGNSLQDVTGPLRVMAALQPQAILISCAAGGLNPRYQVGDLVVIDEHASLLDGQLGGNMTAPGDPPLFDARLQETGVLMGIGMRRAIPTCDPLLANIALQIAQQQQWTLHFGSYLAVTGPNYETRAECRMIRSWGFDLVGMSTVPEIVLARHLGLRTMAIGIVTNLAIPDAPAVADHTEVLQVGNQAGLRLQQIAIAVASSLR